MVKIFLFFCIFVSLAFSQTQKELIDEQIREILPQNVYEENKLLLDVLFTPSKNYIKDSQVEPIKIVKTLKENGLLKLFFDKPVNIELDFKTNSSAVFFVKVMSDTLRNIGYFRFVTKYSNYDSSQFVWSISLVSEYVTDPVILQKELLKSGAKIIKISRKTPYKWEYTIDMTNAHLNVDSLSSGFEMKLKRSLFAYWLDIPNIRKLKIISAFTNRWYPDISYYDASLHLVKVVKIDKKTSKLSLKMPKNAKYIKIADIYTMKNIKDYLLLKPLGER
jgi:hypothetical protein